MKLVSIICPVYNSEIYLPKLIESVKMQTYSYFECLFVDDASTDKSITVIKNNYDNRFILMENEINMGAQKCRELGFNRCRGEFVVFIDSDDYLHPDYLKKMFEKITKDDADIVMCQYAVIDTNNKILRVNKKVTPLNKNKFPLTASTYPQVLLSKPAFWNKLYRFSFLKNNIIFPKVSLAQDLSTIPILFAKGKIAYVDEVLYFYRIHKYSISNTYDKRIRKFPLSFKSILHLKKQFYNELEFMAIGHFFYQISKVLFIKDKSLRITIYQELLAELKHEFPQYLQNVYYKKRFDYRLYVYILKKKILFSNNVLNKIITFVLNLNIINHLIRKSDK